MLIRLGRAAVIAVAALTQVGIGLALAHEVRQVGDFTLVVGFANEPVYVGEESGLELMVSRGEEPVEGLEETLQAQVTYDGQTRDLPLSPAFGEPGTYRSVFIPTATGTYTFHISGTIDGTEIDEEFRSGPDTFGPVEEVAEGQFPVVYPAVGDVVRDAEAGAGAATTATIAIVLGAAGLLAGLVALGLTLARRRA